MEQFDWTREKAEGIICRDYGFFIPDILGLNYMKRSNNTEQDLDAIKRDLRELFA